MSPRESSGGEPGGDRRRGRCVLPFCVVLISTSSLRRSLASVSCGVCAPSAAAVAESASAAPRNRIMGRGRSKSLARRVTGGHRRSASECAGNAGRGGMVERRLTTLSGYGQAWTELSIRPIARPWAGSCQNRLVRPDKGAPHVSDPARLPQDHRRRGGVARGHGVLRPSSRRPDAAGADRRPAGHRAGERRARRRAVGRARRTPTCASAATAGRRSPRASARSPASATASRTASACARSSTAAGASPPRAP